jgi:hypothetical protein
VGVSWRVARSRSASSKNVKILSWNVFAMPRIVGGSRDNERVTDTALALAHRLLDQAADAVAAVAESGGDDELLSLLAVCESAERRLDRAVVDAVAVLERRGVFAERGYRSTAGALADLVGWGATRGRAC